MSGTLREYNKLYDETTTDYYKDAGLSEKVEEVRKKKSFGILVGDMVGWGDKDETVNWQLEVEEFVRKLKTFTFLTKEERDKKLEKLKESIKLEISKI